jgi:predicted small lipoprotein YifL
MISSARTLLLVPVLLFSLAGCGLKGPLYLPDERPDEVPAQAPATPPPGVPEGKKVRTPLPPAPQSQKKDRERANPQSSPTQSAPTQAEPPPVSPPDDPDRPATTPPPPGQ